MAPEVRDELHLLVLDTVMPAVRALVERQWGTGGSTVSWVESLQQERERRGDEAVVVASSFTCQLEMLASVEHRDLFGIDEETAALIIQVQELMEDLHAPDPQAVRTPASVSQAYGLLVSLLLGLQLDDVADQVREAELGLTHLPDAGSTPAPAADQAAPTRMEDLLEVQVPDVFSYTQAHLGQIPVDYRPVDGPAWDLPGWRVRLGLTGPDGDLGRSVEVPLGADREVMTSREIRALLLPLLNLRKLEEISGAVDCTVSVQVSRHGVAVADYATTLSVLGPRMWQLLLDAPQGQDGLLVGVPRMRAVSLETLAAFVQPNDPQIAELAGEASAILHRATGRSALDGYQSGDPGRVDAIAEAVFEAMQARHITYVEPPVSWVAHTQEIRTPTHVLATPRQGTCLDTTVVYAAALEYAGLRPLLWVTAGHIFVGYWRGEQTSHDSAILSPQEVANLVELGAIHLVETTRVTSEEAVDWAAMHRAQAQQYLTRAFVEGTSQAQAVVDIHWLRHHEGLIPLPARTHRSDGSVQIVEYTAQYSRAATAGPTPPRAPDQPEEPDVPARVQSWKNALLDLTLRNRLLNFPRNARLPLLIPAQGLAEFEDMVHAGVDFTLRPLDEVPAVQAQAGVRTAEDLPPAMVEETLFGGHVAYLGLHEEAYRTRLRSLARVARTTLQESGANNLFLSVGNLRWTSDERELWSPLVLIPVNLRPARGGRLYRLCLDDTGSSTPNYSLLERLRKEFNLEIPEYNTPVEDGAGVDIDRLFQTVRTAMQQAGLPFSVEPHVDLAFLDFGRFRLWKDLDESWESFQAAPLVNHLIHTPTEPFVDPVPAPTEEDLDDVAANLPVPADSSQARAVQLAMAGRTFVIEGPPGTGKSQTITSLLARAMAEGKKVLFVAEKQAALEVVSRRLEEVGVGPFVLNLHDRGQKPAAVKAKLRAALEYQPAPDEQGWRAAVARMEQPRRRLATYRDQLHQRTGLGLSLYTAHTQLLALDDVAPAPIPPAFVREAHTEDVEALRHTARAISDLGVVLRDEEMAPWQMVTHPLPPEEVQPFYRAARAVDAALARLWEVAPDLRPLLLQVPARVLWEQLIAVESHHWMTWEMLSRVHSGQWQEAARRLRGTLATLERMPTQVFTLYDPAVLHTNLDQVREEWAQVEHAFFGRRRRRTVIARLERFTRPETQVSEDEFGGVLNDLLTMRDGAHQAHAGIQEVTGLRLPAQWDPIDPRHRSEAIAQLDYLEWVAQLAKPGALPDTDALARTYAQTRSGYQHSTPRGDALRHALAALEQVGTWVDPWQPGVLARWLERREDADPAHLSEAAWRRWSDLLQTLQPLADRGLEQTREAYLTNAVPREEAHLGLQAGIAHATVSERMVASGLGAFDRERHMHDVQVFAEQSEEVRQRLRTVVPQQIIDQRTFDDPDQVRRFGTYSRLLGGRRRLEIRSLIAEYGDLVTQTTPCVLVSPVSVARFFPPDQQLFDLVVFDEASQIRVADAVGAMGRGRSAVIVGDSRQMPPTAFAQFEATASGEEDLGDPQIAVEDEESILSECVQAGVPRVWLSWHYRSQDESLIAFSNRHYYEGRLSSFPSPIRAGDAQRYGCGIRRVRVDGHFQRSGRGKRLRTNEVEARAVVEEIVRRVHAEPEGLPSVGVVTFNSPQRVLIEDMLRDLDDDRVLEALEDPAGVFVKNLENVQGDERDTILFSTGFSKNDNGVLPMNFGPLNRAGGERRFNVAITRARREVVVYTSFDSHDMRVVESSSEGIRDLQAYLQLAERGVGQSSLAATHATAGVDRHREQIAEALRERGLAVETAVGLSDFRIDLVLSIPEDDGGPGRPVVAVLLDSVSWASRATTGDRDALPVSVLEHMMGWPVVERVWLPEWTSHRTEVLDRLVAATRRGAEDLEPLPSDGEPDSGAGKTRPEETDHGAGKPDLEEPNGAESGPAPEEEPGAGRSATVQEPGAVPEPVAVEPVAGEEPGAGEEQVEHADAPAPPTQSAELRTHPPVPPTQDWAPPSPASADPAPARPADSDVWDPETVSPFRPWQQVGSGEREILDAAETDQHAREAVMAVTRQILRTEAPIREGRLVSLVCAEFDLRRVHHSRQEALLSLFKAHGLRPDAAGFFWPEGGDRETFAGYRSALLAHEGLTIEDVHPQEIRNIARGTPEGTEEEQARAVLGVLGGRRLTTGIWEAITRALGQSGSEPDRS